MIGLKIVEELIELLKSKSKNDEKTHTLLRKYIVVGSKNFSKIFLPFLLDGQKELVLEYLDQL